MAPDTELPTAAHGALLDAALENLRSDERVLAIFLGGSLSTGGADDESDIDLTIVVEDEAAADFLSELGPWFGTVGHPVVVAPGPMPSLVTSLMNDGLRLDVTVERRSSLAARPRRAFTALHDPFGLGAGLSFVVPHYQPSPEWLHQSVEDFLRFLDQLSVIALRQEWITGIDNTWYLIAKLVDLYSHRNRAERTSPRRLNSRLTSSQRSAIESLPPISCDERAIIDVHFAIARLYLPEARLLHTELGLEWPGELEAAVVEHLLRRTGSRLEA